MNESENPSRRRLLAGFAAAATAIPVSAQAQDDPKGVVILIDNNDPYVMGHAIGYSANLSKHFAEHEIVLPIEVVANGRGIDLFRADKTTLEEPLAALKKLVPGIAYSVCDSSKKIAEAKERLSISLVEGAALVPFGIGRVVDLQRLGWAYIHA